MNTTPKTSKRRRPGCLGWAAIAVAVVVAFIVLVTLETPDGDGGKADQSTTSAAPSVTRHSSSTSETEAAASAELRQRFPDLLEGRMEQAVRDDVRNTCHDLAAGEEPDVITKRVRLRFTHPDAPTAEQTAGIVDVIRRVGCTA